MIAKHRAENPPFSASQDVGRIFGPYEFLGAGQWYIRNHDPDTDPIAWASAWYYGMVVFLPGAFLKSGIAAGIGALCLPGIAKRLW